MLRIVIGVGIWGEDSDFTIPGSLVLLQRIERRIGDRGVQYHFNSSSRKFSLATKQKD